MSDFVGEPPRRLKEQRDQTNLFERLAGQAARDLPRAQPLSPTALARIAARIDDVAPAPRWPRRYGWALATAAFLMGIATAASAQRWDGLRRWLTQAAAPKSEVPGSRTASTARPRASNPQAPATAPDAHAGRAEPVEPAAAGGAAALPAQPAPAEQVTTAQEEPAPATRRSPPASPSARAAGHAPRTLDLAFVEARAAPEMPRAAAAHAGLPSGAAGGSSSAPERSTPSPEPTVTPSAPPAKSTANPGPTAGGSAQATRHLSQAVRALRVEHSPTAALQLLDRHATDLEGNAFAREALLLRVEAMLALDRQAEVLRLLDRTPLAQGTAARVLLLMRGRLRAAANRCSEALGDFDLVLAQSRQPAQPALLGRAWCRRKLGDREGAKADVERYRREFPGDRAIDEIEGPGTR